MDKVVDSPPGSTQPASSVEVPDAAHQPGCHTNISQRRHMLTHVALQIQDTYDRPRAGGFYRHGATIRPEQVSELPTWAVYEEVPSDRFGQASTRREGFRCTAPAHRPPR